METPRNHGDPLQSRRCGARTRRQGGAPCQNWAMPNGRCRLHGGKSPRGIASPSFRHGRYSQDLPARLGARCEEAWRDPEWLGLTSEVALVDTRISDLLTRVDQSEAGQGWQAARAAARRLDTAIAGGDQAAIRRAHGALVETIEAGHEDATAWAEVMALIDQRRRLVETERRRWVAERRMITVEEGMALVAAVTEAVRRHVQDPDALRAIATEFARLVDRPPPTSPDASG